jgi:hypothetical protein
MPYHLVDRYSQFGGTCYLLRHSSKPLATSYQITWYFNQKTTVITSNKCSQGIEISSGTDTRRNADQSPLFEKLILMF